MPLARILTLRPDEAMGLFEQLQQLGFDVEVTSPHERNLATADLEIEFAICDQQQVLGRAAAIANQLQADVVVFPGALPLIPKKPVVEEVPVFAPEPVEMEAPGEPVETPVEQEPVVVPAAEQPGEQIQRIAWTATIAEGLRKSGRRFSSVAGVLTTRTRSSFARLKPLIANAVLRFKSTTNAAGSAVADRTREYQDRMKARAAQAQTNRAKRLAEMERVRAEAREQVAVLERARMAAEAQHQQLQRLDAEAATRQHEVEVKGGRPRIFQVRGVFAGVAAAVALFLVGILLANFHGKEPLAPNLTEGSIEQQVPFGPATVHGPPGVTLGPKTTKSAPAATPIPAASIAARPSSKPRPAVGTTQARQQKSEWRHFRKRSAGEEDDVADDVIVRHFGPPRKQPTQTAQRNDGIKRYSDQ